MDPFSFDRLVCQHHRQSAAMAEMHFRFSRVAFPVSFSFLLRPVAFIGGKGEGGPERVMALQACLGKPFVVGRIRTMDLKAETQDFHFPTSLVARSTLSFHLLPDRVSLLLCLSSTMNSNPLFSRSG